MNIRFQGRQSCLALLTVAASIALLSAGCANVGGRDISLLPSSKVLDPLEVPPGLSPVQESETFVIPDRPGENFEQVTNISREQFRNIQMWKTFEQYKQFRAEQSGSNLSEEEFRAAKERGQGIFRVVEFKNDEGKTRWVVYDEFSSVWDRTLVVLNDLGVRVYDADRENGIMYVKGVSPQESPTFLQRIGVKEYAGRIDELHFEQISGEAVQIIPKSEFLVEADYSSSSIFASELRYFLLANYQVFPEGTESTGKVTVGKRLVDDEDGGQYVELAEPFDRAWIRVGRTLEAAGLVIVDLDRAAGDYLVSFTPVEEATRSRWLFWRKKTKKRQIGDEIEYTVTVAESGDATKITITATDEQDAESAADLLGVLYERLTT